MDSFDSAMTDAVVLEAGREGEDAARRDIPPGREFVIGRGGDADWSIPDDPHLSRSHVAVRLEDGKLLVRRLPGSKNPVFYLGTEKTEFALRPGEHFVIGTIRFRLVPEKAAPAAEATVDRAAPSLRHTMTDADLYAMGTSGDKMRLHDLLELPEILRTKNPREFHLHIATMIRLATGAAWATIEREDGEILARDARGDGPADARSSRALKRAALDSAPNPALYCWKKAGDLGATAQEGVDWAVCAAVKVPNEPSFLLYAAGEGQGPGAQRENSRFIGLVADMVSRSLSVKRLEISQTRLEHYFSGPIITKILQSKDASDLAPKVAESTVMFFDIRGFSKRTEGKNEKILQYLGELRGVMTAMTEEIFKENGVVLQYMGDGILACWNMPFPEEDHVDRACRAALRMTERIGEVADGWRCGIGIHTGPVVGGSIGSEQVFYFGLMGAVVNQASRIEGITKVIETPILVTKEAAEKLSPRAGAAQRIGRFRPAGMTVALELYELSPPPGDPARAEAFEKGAAAFEKGEWERAYEALDALPAKDLPARYLKSLAESYRRRPPKDWQGIIELSEK